MQRESRKGRCTRIQTDPSVAFKMEPTAADITAMEDVELMEKRIVRKMDIRIMPAIIICEQHCSTLDHTRWAYNL